MKFEDILDVSKLDDQQIGHLAYVLNSPSYTDVFEPYLRRMRSDLNLWLLDPSGERKERMPDDFIRGGIVMLDGLLTLFTRLLDEISVEQISRTQVELTGDQQYEAMHQAGQVKPMSGPYDPDQDF